MSNHLYVSICSTLYLSHSSRGVIPSFSAWVSVAVPYSSVPQIYNVLRFLVRLYLNISVGRHISWPMNTPTEHIGAERASDDIS
jgi:hypothetical protein